VNYIRSGRSGKQKTEQPGEPALPSGYIAIMAYRDKALGPNSTVEISRGELDYGRKNALHVKVWLGQETADVKGDPPSITFWQEGQSALNEEPNRRRLWNQSQLRGHRHSSLGQLPRFEHRLTAS